MTGPNTPPHPSDIARLIARVDDLERRLKRGGATLDSLEDVDTPLPNNDDLLGYNATLGRWENKTPAAGVDGLWEIDTSGSLAFRPSLKPLQSLVDSADIQYLLIELEAHQGPTSTTSALHHAYLYVAPGIGGGGGDIQAEATNPGHDNVMDWFFWTRHGGSDQWEAGSFWDAIGIDESNGNGGEGFIEVYADGDSGFVELLATTTDGTAHNAEIDLISDTTAGAGNSPGNGYIHVFGDWIVFRADPNTVPLDVAADAAMTAFGTWSIGYDGVDTITLKGRPTAGGATKTATITLT